MQWHASGVLSLSDFTCTSFGQEAEWRWRGVVNLADFTCTSFGQEAEWRWRGVVMRMRRMNWRSSKQRDSHFFLFKRINMWYHDAFHYFLSIYVRYGQFTFGPVKFSYVLAQMACKFRFPKSLTAILLSCMVLREILKEEATFNQPNYWFILFSFHWHKILVLVFNKFIYAKVVHSEFVEMREDASYDIFIDRHPSPIGILYSPPG